MVFIDEEVCKKYRKIVFGRRKIQCIRYLTDRVHDVSLKHCQIFCVFDRVIKHFLLYGTHIRVSSIQFHWIFTFDEEYDGLKCTYGVLLHIRTFENTTYHFITFLSYNFTVYWLHIQLLHHIQNYLFPTQAKNTTVKKKTTPSTVGHTIFASTNCRWQLSWVRMLDFTVGDSGKTTLEWLYDDNLVLSQNYRHDPKCEVS